MFRIFYDITRKVNFLNGERHFKLHLIMCDLVIESIGSFDKIMKYVDIFSIHNYYGIYATLAIYPICFNLVFSIGDFFLHIFGSQKNLIKN
jgi:hypothetical protein